MIFPEDVSARTDGCRRSINNIFILSSTRGGARGASGYGCSHGRKKSHNRRRLLAVQHTYTGFAAETNHETTKRGTRNQKYDLRVRRSDVKESGQLILLST